MQPPPSQTLSLFQTLPPEVNTHILDNFPTSQVFSVCGLPEFEGVCNWYFWRTRCLQDYGVPYYYFDLAQDRGISGLKRYLEVASRFELLPEMLTTDDLNKGIFDPQTFFYMAFDQNRVDLMELAIDSLEEYQIIGAYNFKVMEEYRDIVIGLTRNYPVSWRQLVGHFSVSLFLYNRLSGTQATIYDLYPNLPPVFMDIEAKNWTAVDQQLTAMGDSDNTSRAILSLFYTQNETAFSVARKHINIANVYIPFYLSYFLRIALQCGNESQVDWLLQFFPNIPAGTFKEYLALDSLSEYAGAFDRVYDLDTNNAFYSYLLDAYVGGNLRLVERFESYGYRSPETDLSSIRISEAIVLGRLNRLSNPVSTYELVKAKVTIPITKLPSDTDITQLAVDAMPATQKTFYKLTKELFKPQVRVRNHRWIPGQLGCNSALEWLLRIYGSVPGVNQLIGDYQLRQGIINNAITSYDILRIFISD